MIPDHKRAAVDRAFTEAFGTATVDELEPLAGGLSTALVMRAVVRGRPYLLRVIMRTEAHWDPTKQIACIEKASKAGIAPVPGCRQNSRLIRRGRFQVRFQSRASSANRKDRDKRNPPFPAGLSMGAAGIEPATSRV